MNTPDNITCPITDCNYMIITAQQNKDFFQEYFNDTKFQLNNGKKIIYSFRFHSFPYGKYIKILQIAECFDGDLQTNYTSINLKNGMFLIFPFEKDIKDKLGELLIHTNVTIITYDFTLDVTNLIDEQISFNFKSIIDGNINRFTGSKMFELPFSSLTTACKKSKNFRPIKNTKSENKNKQNYHTSSEFLYLLHNSDEPINDLNNKFWESIVNDCAYVAYACSNTISNLGIDKIKQFSSEKVKSFCEIQMQYGTFGPFLMKKFFNDDKLLHSTDISSENYAYDLWIAAQNALINNDIYNKIVPKEKAVSKSDILNLQKKAEKKILHLDTEPPPVQQPSFQSSSTKSTTPNDKISNDDQPNNLNSNGIESWKKITKNIQNEVKTAKKRTGNSRIDWMILEIDHYVKQNLIYLKDLETNWDNLYPNFYNIQKALQFNDPSFILIEKSIQNIKKYNNKLTSRKINSEKKKLITHNVNDILLTINIFLSFISNTKIKKESKIIEKKLFKVIFNPTDDDSFITKIFSVYQKHNDFIFTQDSIANFKSSTGSGKTRCAPFFFAIKAIEDNMKKPFFIMTQPGFSIIKDKMKDFQNILCDSVKLVTDIWEMVDLYKSFKERQFKLFSKPIVGLFSPQSLLTLIHKLQKRKINICSITRFCLDEIHERSVESDVLEAILSSNMNEMIKNGKNFPLQLLMMSATPDTRILNCFKKVVRFELPNSQLFNVETIKIQVENKNQVNKEVFNQTCEIVKKMATRKIQNGHILIFTSGNSRINDIQTEIFENSEEICSSENCIVFVIKHFDLMFKNSDINLFYSNLDEFIRRETNRINSYYKRNRYVLFLLPIKYMGYVSNEQKEIGKNPIPKHSNVIKIIMATNAIESSITIDGLAAVVDSGLFNHSFYDKNNGLTSLNEEPISIQSQTQRKGRVGRLRPGISVQITLKDKQLPVLLPPAIRTSDISLNILSLRKIGYKLEYIKNLPDSLEKAELDKYISELVSFDALDENTHNLTSYGRVLGSFSFVSPFIASAIIKVAGFKPDEIIGKISEKMEDKNEIEKQFRLLLGILISLLFGAHDLCVNRFSKKLREFFDKKSDIITLLRTLLDLAQMKTIDIKQNAFYYGLNAQIAVKILGQVQQTAENLFFSSKEMHQFDLNEKIEKPSSDTNKNEPETINKKEKENLKKSPLNIVIGAKNSNNEQNKGPVIQKTNSGSISIERNNSSKITITKSSAQQIQINSIIKNPEKESINIKEQEDKKDTEEQNNNKEQNDDDDIEENINKEKTSNKLTINNSNQEIHHKYFSRKNIFKYLQQLVEKLISENLLYQFIQDLINEIGKNKPEWINCRKATFANIEYAYDEPSFIYSGSKSLSTDNSRSYICVKMRPGSFGIDSPGSVFILSITHEMNSRMNFGSLIHCDINEEKVNPIPHPISIETSSRLFNDFSEPLIKSYLCDNMNHFKKFCRERWNRNDEGNCLLFKSQEVISDSNTKYYFSFIPKDDTAIELFNEASKTIEPLLAYTPSTLLIKHPNLKCAIAIHGVGTNVIDSSVHFFNSKDYFPYKMNKKTINFLLKNIQYLSSIDDIISIGITGESFCYPLGDATIKKQQYSKIWYPQSNSNCSSVFSNEPFYYSHLIMLSKVELIEFNDYLLSWDADRSSLEFVEDDLILHAANEIARELITVRKSFNRLLIKFDNSYLRTKGTLDYSYSSINKHNSHKEKGEINKIFDSLVKKYIQGDSLIRPVELTALFYAIPKDEFLPDIGRIPKTLSRKVFGYGCICLDVEDDNSIEEVKNNVTERLRQLEEVENKAFKIINEDQELKQKTFDLIDSNPNLKNDLLISIDEDTNILIKYYELTNKLNKIKENISKRIESILLNSSNYLFESLYSRSFTLDSTFPIFSGNENKDKIFELINQYKQLRCIVFESISDYYINNFIDHIDLTEARRCVMFCSSKIKIFKTVISISFENEEIQKKLFNDIIGINIIKSHIISNFNSNRNYNHQFLQIINQNSEIKDKFLVLFCHGEISKNIFSIMRSNLSIKSEIFEQIKQNEELKSMFFNHINHREILQKRIGKEITKDSGMSNKIIQILKQNNGDNKTYEKERKQMKRTINVFTLHNLHSLDLIKKESNEPKIEILQVYSVTIKHHVRSSLTKEQFEKKVTSVVSLFGAIIVKQHPYSERWAMNGMIKGTITILMYSLYFTLPLVSMIKEALQETDSLSTLNIPNNIIDNVLLNDYSVSNILKLWFKSNNLNIKQNELQLTGSEKEVKTALEKLKKNPPEIPFNSYPLQGHINLFQINNHIKHLNRNKETKWYLNKATRTLLIPSTEDENEVSKFFGQFNINMNKIESNENDDDVDGNNIDKILWDIDFHQEEAILSRYYINVHLQNGKLIQRHFCVECVYETFLFNLRKMYNADEDRGIYEEIINDDNLIPQMSFVECKQIGPDKNNLVQMFPVIPFGQLIWAFINEAKISNQTRTWITALCLRILKKTPKITFCPLHPYILFPSPPIGTSMKCATPNCCFSLCCWCNKWHKSGHCEKEPEIPPGVRECPFCHEIIEKMEKCNHIHCRCGKDFCYYCGKGFSNDSDCYKHMGTERHWEEAPDYMMFIQHKTVDIDVLNQFYEKYPKLKPKLKDS